MASITIDNVHKRYGSAAALKGVSLSIQDGEFMTLVGPSGCGKSTLLRTIAGLEPQSAGDVLIDGVKVNGVRPSERNLSMVFQSYALYPHLSVFDNIAVPLRMRHHNRWQRMPLLCWFVPGTRRNEALIREQILATAESLGLEQLLQRKPGQLSGGQRQRVAVGRAIVREPRAFLLDEPLSNLDAKMRVHMRTEITQLHRSLQATFVYVTHDQAEAMTMSDRIAVMMDGEIVQTGTPNEIYHHPSDIRVAEFIGSPKINILPAARLSDTRVAILGFETPLCCDASIESVGVRPEACSVSLPGDVVVTGEDDAPLTLTGNISHLENFGAEVFVHVDIDGLSEPIVVRSDVNRGDPTLTHATRIGDQVAVTLQLNRSLGFDGNGQVVDMLLPGQVAPVGTAGTTGTTQTSAYLQ